MSHPTATIGIAQLFLGHLGFEQCWVVAVRTAIGCVAALGSSGCSRRPRLHDCLAFPRGRRVLVRAALVPLFECGASLFDRKSARTSTRFGRGPAAGVTQ